MARSDALRGRLSRLVRPIFVDRRGHLFRLMRHIFVDRLTPAGRSLFWIGLLALGTGSLTLIIQIYLVLCIIVALFLVSMLVARVARTTLRIEAEIPHRTACGVRLTLPVVVHNPSRKPALDVMIQEWDPPHAITQDPPHGLSLGTVAPGQTMRCERLLDFQHRGAYELPGIVQESLFPWGLWRDRRIHRQRRNLLVYPRFAPLSRLDIPVGKRYQPGGIALSSNLGDSIEFIGTREFRNGDAVRAIHWRTWARLGKPAVKEFQEEYFCRVVLLLDTFVPARQSARAQTDFEAALSLAAAIADSLAREEYIIDIFAAGPEIYYLQSGRSLAYLENVFDILACLEPCHEPPFEKIAPVIAEHLGNVTTTVVVMLDWDARREAMVRLIREHGSAVKMVLVRTGDPTTSLAEAESLVDSLTHLDAATIDRGVDFL